MSLKRELTVPDGVTAAAGVIAGLDGCLKVGFGRLAAEHADALQALADAVAGSPLAEPVADAVTAVAENQFLDKHFAALALARAALQGAQHDSLVAEARGALGRPPLDAADPQPASPVGDGPVAVWQESARNWLMEIALAGFARLESETLAPFTATLERLQDEPAATRLAAVLTGLQNELIRALPIDEAGVPTYRWADLWTRSMVAAVRAPAAAEGESIAGEFLPIGGDFRRHGFFVSLEVYGLLNGERLTRVPLSAYTVDVLAGDDLWRAFPESAHPLLEALSSSEGVQVKGATLLPTGDLLCDGQWKKGNPAKVLDVCAAAMGEDITAPRAAAVDRHPLHVAEPVLLGQMTLPVATGRAFTTDDLTPDHVAKAKRVFGLLRFDGGAWAVQPLRADGKFIGAAAAKHLKPPKNDPLGQLRERAGRLLREKA